MYSSASRQLVALDQAIPDGLCAVASTIVLAENRVYQPVESAWRQFKPSSTLIVKNWMEMFLQSANCPDDSNVTFAMVTLLCWTPFPEQLQETT